MRSSRLCTDGSPAAAADWDCGGCGGGDDCASNALGVNEKRSSSNQREPINRLLKPNTRIPIASSCTCTGKGRGISAALSSTVRVFVQAWIMAIDNSNGN